MNEKLRTVSFKKEKENKISWCGSSHVLTLVEQGETQLEREGVEKPEDKW